MDEQQAGAPYTAVAADDKYRRLTSHSLIASLLRLFTARPEATLLSFDQVQELLRGRNEVNRGTQMIPLANIVGSVGRYRDFTRAFLPLGGADEQRWKNLDVAMNELRSLPPIEVYKIGDVYFVRDGNHRVSVAKANDLTHIEAQVMEIETRVPLTPDVDVDDLICKAEYAHFLEQTHLDETRPDQTIELTEPGRYRHLLGHIDVHRYYLEVQLQRNVSQEEAAASWYDTVYLPVVEGIRESGVLHEFPKRTEADLYLWVAYHRERLRKQYGYLPASSEVALALAEQYSDRPLNRLVKTVVRAITAAVKAASESPAPPDEDLDTTPFTSLRPD